MPYCVLETLAATIPTSNNASLVMVLLHHAFSVIVAFNYLKAGAALNAEMA